MLKIQYINLTKNLFQDFIMVISMLAKWYTKNIFLLNLQTISLEIKNHNFTLCVTVFKIQIL